MAGKGCFVTKDTEPIEIRNAKYELLKNILLVTLGIDLLDILKKLDPMFERHGRLFGLWHDVSVSMGFDNALTLSPWSVPNENVSMVEAEKHGLKCPTRRLCATQLFFQTYDGDLAVYNGEPGVRSNLNLRYHLNRMGIVPAALRFAGQRFVEMFWGDDWNIPTDNVPRLNLWLPSLETKRMIQIATNDLNQARSRRPSDAILPILALFATLGLEVNRGRDIRQG